MSYLASLLEIKSGIALNSPKSSEYITNSNGQVLHIRSHVSLTDTSKPPTAVIISLHGYASHGNRPPHDYIGRELNLKNIAYINLDFHGHGYSDGVRALVNSFVNLVDDVVSLLLALYSDTTMNEEQNYSIAQNMPSTVPFFLMGHSMGGTCAILTSNFLCLLSEDGTSNGKFINTNVKWQNIRRLFKGCVLLCPAVEVKGPPFIVKSLLANVIAPLFPTMEIPSSLSTLSDNSLVWIDPKYIDYVLSDQQPGGLSWGGSLRLQTAVTLLYGADEVKASLHKMSYPFVVFHDPEDGICSFKGSELLFTNSATEEKDKELRKLPGGRHDLLGNMLEETTASVLEWVLKRLASS